MMNFEIVVLAAVAVVLAASPADAQSPTGSFPHQPGEQATSGNGATAGDMSGNAIGTPGPALHYTAGEGQEGNVPPISRAGRDTTLRTRAAMEVRGRNADGLGNVTADVEVAGASRVLPAGGAVSGSGSVETGSN